MKHLFTKIRDAGYKNYYVTIKKYVAFNERITITDNGEQFNVSAEYDGIHIQIPLKVNTISIIQDTDECTGDIYDTWEIALRGEGGHLEILYYNGIDGYGETVVGGLTDDQVIEWIRKLAIIDEEIYKQKTELNNFKEMTAKAILGDIPKRHLGR